MSALDSLLGNSGDPVACHVLPGIEAHWWPSTARPGDVCLCGKVRKCGDRYAGEFDLNPEEPGDG
ncbi:MAG: hypothetical protein ACRD0W_09635 [Acidimicrobiales bacterium]